MVNVILATVSASLSEFKRNPIATLTAGNGGAVAILHRNRPVFYCVPAEEYAAMLDRIDDAELNAIADERSGMPSTAHDLNEV